MVERMPCCASGRNPAPSTSSPGSGHHVRTTLHHLRSALPGLALAVLAALLPAAPLAADERIPGLDPALAQQLSERARQRGMDPAAALAPVAEAAWRGLPAAPVANKILEGLAKGAAPERVAAVGGALVERLGEASRLLGAAEQAGLRAAPDRAAALSDLAGALQDGVRPEAVDALVAAAREARQGSESVVAAARVLGELMRRGVQDAAVRPLGASLARRGAGAAAQVTALFDAWRAEGGRDAGRFAAEAAGRLDRGQSLDGLVDWFAETDDRLHRAPAAGESAPGAAGRADPAKAKDTGPGERADAARGAVPGFDDAVRGAARGKKKGQDK